MILIINLNDKRLSFYEFVAPLCSIVTSLKDCEVKHYTRVGNVAGYEKIILSGTPLKDNKYLAFPEEFGWIKECRIPFLGICAGMQIIGLMFDCTVAPCREIGMHRIVTVKENPLVSSTFFGYELHNYGIEPSSHFDVLARSERCIQVVRHREREIYGVLFHPEARNKEIIERFVLM